MLEVHSLASGSSGNAVLVKAADRALLIDAGVPGRPLAAAMAARGIRPGMLDGILLTHEHDDHLRGAAIISARYDCPVIANRATLEAASYRLSLGNTVEMETASEIRLGEFTARSFAIPHDAAAPVGYVIDADSRRIAYATDCGRVTRSLRDAMRGADLCILESNHDLDWLMRGPYPPIMKRRVASDYGHLSNHDAAGFLAERLEQDGPTTIWLAHLSKVNNSPAFARKYALEQIASLTKVPFHLEIALRDRPSVMWRPSKRPVQLTLF